MIDEFADVSADPLVATAQRDGVSVTIEERDRLAGVELVLRARPFAVIDGRG